MNILTVPSINSKDIVNLKFTTQNQKNQKKLLDFLINKDISFSRGNSQNYEALIQIYNITANKKQKSLSRTSSQKADSSRSPNKKNLSQTPKKETKSTKNLGTSSTKENKKKNKNIERKVSVEKEQNISKTSSNDDKKVKNKDKETTKKKAMSTHVKTSKNLKENKNLFLDELHKNLGETQKNNGNKKSRGSLQQNNDHTPHEKRKKTTEVLKETEKLNERKKSRPSLKENSENLQHGKRNSRDFQENLMENEKRKEKENHIKNKKSLKNDSSMKILEKNKHLLDNLINAHSVVEFDATRNATPSKKNMENSSKASRKSETQEENIKRTLEKKRSKDFDKKNESTKKSSQIGNKKNSKSQKKSSAFQESSKENTKENRNTQLSEKIENDFKQIVNQEFSHVPSGEKINKTSLNIQFQKAVQILYERLDLLSSEELIFYYKFIVNKAKKLYLDFLQKRGLIVN